MAGLTRDLAGFVASLRFEDVPAEALDTVKRGFIDCVGVMFAGRDEAVVALLVKEGLHSPKPEAALLFDRGRTSAPDAALINGTAGHALDYDDVAIDGHPSVVLVPAILAEAERLGASGAEMAAAYVAGYEVWGELASRDEDKLHGKGWHPTAVFGSIAAAAAGARLARLDASRTTHALAAAASMSAGLTANFGSMTKPLQAGRAAQSGLLAARYAASGLTASPDAIEHRNGMLRAFSPAGRFRADGPLAAGRDWHIVKNGLNIKRYPVCYALHRSIDGILALRAQRPFQAGEIREIEMVIGRHQANMLRHSRPQTGLDAKFSAEFAAASAAEAGRVGLAELTDGFVRRQEIQSLLPKVKVTAVDDPDPDDPLFSKADAVRITLGDGTVLSGAPIARAKGHAHNPVTLGELRGKFDDCLGQALPSPARDRLYDRLAALEHLPAAGALYGA